MSVVNTGGAAFPTGTGVTPYNPGMTLRDYFAAQALECRNFTVRPYDNTIEIAKDCYKMADAMLKARTA